MYVSVHTQVVHSKIGVFVCVCVYTYNIAIYRR